MEYDKCYAPDVRIGMILYNLIKRLGISRYVYGLLSEQGKKYANKIRRKLEIKICIKNGYPKLNLGGGRTMELPDHINIDKFDPRADIKADICERLKFKDDSVSGIVMSHVLDHLPRKKVNFVLEECHRVLREGCKLEVVVQNSKVYQKEWLEGDTDYKRGWGVINIYGHDEEGAYHKNAFTKETLELELREAGFNNIQCYVTETRPYTKLNNCFEYRKNGDIRGTGVK